MLSFKQLNLLTLLLSVVLGSILIGYPAVIFKLFSIDGNASAYFISRRAAMFFVGYAVICYASREIGPSQGRRAISLGIAVSMLCFALLGLAEFVRGFAGQGIFLAIGAESLLALSYFQVWRRDASEVNAA